MYNHFHSSHPRLKAESWFLPQCYSSGPTSFQGYQSYWTPSPPWATGKERGRKMNKGDCINLGLQQHLAGFVEISDSLIWIYRRRIASNNKKDNEAFTQWPLKQYGYNTKTCMSLGTSIVCITFFSSLQPRPEVVCNLLWLLKEIQFTPILKLRSRSCIANSLCKSLDERKKW